VTRALQTSSRSTSADQSLTAVARLQPQAALRHARVPLAHVGAVGISHDCVRWAWPLAARAAYELRDTAAMSELRTLLGSWPPGHLPPMLRAERDLPLARGPLDQAKHLASRPDPAAAGLARDEDRGIAERLRCQPLLDRAAVLLDAEAALEASTAARSDKRS
jgi:hypothetical protein